jgi:ATP-binding cassette subfamily F protein uup
VALARLLRQPANLVILDEPTNDLDLASLSALEEMLVEYSITALVVTHDRWFLDRVASAILAFEGGGKIVRYAGNYQALQHARQSSEKPTEESRRPTRAPRNQSKKKPLSWAEARELEGLLESIEAAEARVEELGTLLSQPDTYQKTEAKIVQLTADLEAARKHVEGLTARWEELETKKAEGEG